MSRNIQIFFLFLVIIISAWILPALFGFNEQTPLVIFFLSLILYWGIQPNLMIPAMMYGLAGDMLLGFPLGLFVLSFFLTVLLLLGLQRFIEIRPLARSLIPRFGSSYLGTIIAASMGYFSLSFLYALFEKITYNQEASLHIIDSQLILYVSSALIICLILLWSTEKRIEF